MALRELIAEFGVKFDDSELKRGNKSVETGISQMKAFIGVVAGSALVVGLKNMVMGLAEEADALNKQSRALGFSMEEFQGWKHAAGLAGVEGEAFGKSVAKMQRAAAEAADGVATYGDAFKTAGVDVKTATGDIKPTAQILDELATGIMSIKDPARRTATAMDIFGRQGVAMIGLFESGPEGIKKLREELEELGGGFTPEFAANAEEMNDNLSRVELATTSLKVALGSFLLPVISKAAIGTARLIGKFAKWVKETGLVDRGMQLLKTSVAWLGGMGLAKLYKLSGGFKRIALVVARFAATFLLPILALDELITFFQGGDTLIGRAMDAMFGEGTSAIVRDFVVGVFREIKGLLSRIVMAFSVDGFDKIKALFPDMSEGWATFLAGLIVTLQTTSALIVAIFTGDTEKIGAAWDYLSTWLEAIALEFDAPFVMAAMRIADAFAAAWNGIISGAQSMLASVSGIVDKIPGGRKLLDAVSSGLEGAKAGTGRAGDMQGRYDMSRLDIAQRMDQAATRFAGPSGGASISAPTVVNVNVPPGTPASQAKAVGNAAAAGASRGNRATLNAVKRLAPG